MKAASCVPLKVTGNTGGIAVRQPASPIARRLLARFGMPLIATSANISGHPTCSQASEVLATLGRNLALILDSPIGDHQIATTVDVTTPKWGLIREGAVLEEELREFLGE